MKKFAWSIGMMLILAACGGGPAASPSPSGPIKAPPTLTIAYQPGIGYAQLLIMRQEKWIETDFPATTVTWRVLTSGDVIRDQIIAGQVQIGAGGTGPFLVGWAKGVDYRLIAGMNEMDLWLNAKDPNLKSLKDFKPGMKIAMPALDAIQAVALKKGAEKELGDPKKLDSLLVSMAHPEGLQNLLSGQINGHFTSPPFQFQEVDQGAHTVYHSKDAFGVTTFNAVYTTRKFYDDYPAFGQKFYDYVKRATDLIHNDPDRAAGIIAAADNRPGDAAKYKGWITHEGIAYTLKPSGFLVQAEFMKQIGLIPKIPPNMKEIELPPLQPLGGS